MFDSPATLLYRLQIVDQAIAQRRNRIKDINTALGQSEAVRQAQKQVDTVTAALKPWQARARDLDLEIKGIASKMKATEDNLYSGRVVAPKALQELQNEIAALKRSQSKLEDNLLEAMMNSEDGQASLDAANKLLNEAQALHAAAQVHLLAEKERLEAELPTLIAQRKDAAVSIDPNMLATYDALRPKKGGAAVALLKEGSCAACQVEQTSNIVQKVQQDKSLISCATCGRILAPRP
jgi:predicted  nucleic acid-binding Zn-ribbon protein